MNYTRKEKLCQLIFTLGLVQALDFRHNHHCVHYTTDTVIFTASELVVASFLCVLDDVSKK